MELPECHDGEAASPWGAPPAWSCHLCSLVSRQHVLGSGAFGSSRLLPSQSDSISRSRCQCRGEERRLEAPPHHFWDLRQVLSSSFLREAERRPSRRGSGHMDTRVKRWHRSVPGTPQALNEGQQWTSADSTGEEGTPSPLPLPVWQDTSFGQLWPGQTCSQDRKWGLFLLPLPRSEALLKQKALRSCPLVHVCVFHILVRDLAKKLLKIISQW
uniref:Uncharacterized protein n=1 Tax=Pipistrellus kuhlii TaxID=59472 RepID=A0A7J7SNJ2_PIPKU|nr:hypothetical protein mPipKuh1_009802 [Pipistrellus kuhlii]